MLCLKQFGLQRTASKVTDGGSFLSALTQMKLYSPAEHHLITVGLTSNSLDQIFLDIARENSESAKRQTERMIALLTPLLTLAMGLIVGGLMMSVMQAILSLNRIVL
jgi:general secretion pathway protein F